MKYTKGEIPHRVCASTVRDLFCPNRMEVKQMRKFTSRNEAPSMEKALRIALAKIGNGEPNIGFVTSDNELDAVAVVNTNRSSKYK